MRTQNALIRFAKKVFGIAMVVSLTTLLVSRPVDLAQSQGPGQNPGQGQGPGQNPGQPFNQVLTRLDEMEAQMEQNTQDLQEALDELEDQAEENTQDLQEALAELEGTVATGETNITELLDELKVQAAQNTQDILDDAEANRIAILDDAAQNTQDIQTDLFDLAVQAAQNTQTIQGDLQTLQDNLELYITNEANNIRGPNGANIQDIRGDLDALELHVTNEADNIRGPNGANIQNILDQAGQNTQDILDRTTAFSETVAATHLENPLDVQITWCYDVGPEAGAEVEAEISPTEVEADATVGADVYGNGATAEFGMDASYSLIGKLGSGLSLKQSVCIKGIKIEQKDIIPDPTRRVAIEAVLQGGEKPAEDMIRIMENLVKGMEPPEGQPDLLTALEEFNLDGASDPIQILTKFEKLTNALPFAGDINITQIFNDSKNAAKDFETKVLNNPRFPCELDPAQGDIDLGAFKDFFKEVCKTKGDLETLPTVIEDEIGGAVTTIKDAVSRIERTVNNIENVVVNSINVAVNQIRNVVRDICNAVDEIPGVTCEL